MDDGRVSKGQKKPNVKIVQQTKLYASYVSYTARPLHQRISERNKSVIGNHIRWTLQGKTCYRFFDIKHSWDTAADVCRSSIKMYQTFSVGSPILCYEEQDSRKILKSDMMNELNLECISPSVCLCYKRAESEILTFADVACGSLFQQHLITLDITLQDWLHPLDNFACQLLHISAFNTPTVLYGSNLVVIDDFEQNTFTSKLAFDHVKNHPSKSYWIGFRTVDDLVTNKLETSAKSFVSKYTGFWEYDQPQPKNGQCTSAKTDGSHSQKWTLNTCEILLPFMCNVEACPKGSFHCGNGKCVNTMFQCDGQDDCGDGSDEIRCPALCNYYMQSSGDTIESPNYPKKYKPNSDCKWTLEGPVGSKLILQFSEFETEENFDTVQILSGGITEETSMSLETLSGEKDLASKLFTTSSNLMIVKFRSDASVERKGFRASWKTEPQTCGGELFARKLPSVLSSVNYPQTYPGGLECVYVVTAPHGQIITLEFTDFDMDSHGDFILIRDGHKPQDRLLANLTGSMAEIPRFVISTVNKLYIYISTDLAVDRKGFNVKYTAESPAFGIQDYPSSQRCTYLIKRPGGGPISLKFNEFSVQQDDYVQVYDGSSESRGIKLHSNKGYTNSSMPRFTLTASSGQMFVQFITDPLRRAAGWKGLFSADCPEIKSGQGAISSSRDTSFGAMVKFTCPLGQEFKLGGTEIMTECLKGGKWSVNAIPDCQERYCGPVPQIVNGFAVEATNVTYRGLATYQCYAGFGFPSGQATQAIKCTHSGKWEKLPVCLASSCPPLIETPHAIQTIMNGGDRSYGTVIRFECEPGYFKTGVPVVVCRSDGTWSDVPPVCNRARCPILPEIENGFLTEIQQNFFFGDEAKVQCHRGYKLVGQSIIRCGPNQTFTNIPECIDIDECSVSSCDTASTICTNTPGSFFCKCKKGFAPNPECRPVGDLGLANGIIPDKSIMASGTEQGYNKNIDLRAPTVIRGFRTQGVTRIDGSVAYATSLKFQHSNNLTDVFHNHYSLDGRPILFRTTVSSGIATVHMPEPLETRYLKIIISSYDVAPCLRIELMGCSRQDCIGLNCNDLNEKKKRCTLFHCGGIWQNSCKPNLTDSDKNSGGGIYVNECLEENGGCDQRCINNPGSFNCLCNVGFELYQSNNTASFDIPYSEDGLRDGDVYRLNKTCVRNCPALDDPENGLLLSTQSMFHFGDIIRFHCDFGYVMVGSSTLLCTSNGVWNGTAPTCEYASCPLILDDPAQGLSVVHDSETKFIPFRENVTFECNDAGLLLRTTATADFRQCVYDPSQSSSNYWLAGTSPGCPRIDCGPPVETPGSTYGSFADTRYRSSFYFGCDETYKLAGKSNQNDNIIRCQEDGTWDFGDLRCEGPVCSDPGRPNDGTQIAETYEQGSEVKFSCNRPGYVPLDRSPATCTRNAVCKVIKPIGMASGVIPDFAINATTQRTNYEAKNVRLFSATGWCGEQQPFTYVTVDLGNIYRITSILVKGVVTNDVVGRPTELRLFYKTKESDNFLVYFPNFNLTHRDLGNYGELTKLPLPLSIQARFIILGIIAFDKNPCMKFELMGCLSQPENEIILGYDNGFPVCVDNEAPQFINCPDAPIEVQRSPNGILQPINYSVPIAVDNSGLVARVEVNPIGFKPPVMIFEDTVITYTAFDFDGNLAVCNVNITVPDKTPPSLQCPQSYVIELIEVQDTYKVNFNESRVLVNATDKAGPITVKFIPETAVIPVGEYRNVTVVASDRFNNEATCHYQVSIQATKCVTWSLKAPANGQVNCLQKPNGNGYRCLASCDDGFQFTDVEPAKTFECESKRLWTPSSIIPDCVPVDTDDASYDVKATVRYRAGGSVPENCLDEYNNYFSTHYTPLNSVLTERCSAVNVKMDVNFHNTKIRSDGENEVIVDYTLRVNPAVQQPLLYDLCGYTLGLIFDLSVPTTNAIIAPIMNISGQRLGSGCPTIRAIKSKVNRGFTCEVGQVLNENQDNIPKCLPCPAGTFAASDEGLCIPCAKGFYQDLTKQGECKACPEGTYTKETGSKAISDCIPACGFGTYSPSGLVPCLQCPYNTFSGPPPADGFKECQRCPANSYTYQPGSTYSQDCKAKCAPGHYSETGLEPCTQCPVNYYQFLEGQSSCFECAPTEFTPRAGAISAEACLPVQCTSNLCRNGGLCIARGHQAMCYCPAGFTGKICDVDVDECASRPCFNKGECIDKPQGYMCRCQPGYSGLQCQIEESDCKNSSCPQRAMCQNLPGKGNFDCLCRKGYTGRTCNITVDPCTSEENPCSNDAECIPLQQGRYWCECKPGWTGRICDNDIDDCAENPCLLQAECTDLVNDFKCKCPLGFTGKRCEIKTDLCKGSPCANGICIDNLFTSYCVCSPGWTGPDCDINIDECASNPCANGGQCIDGIGSYRCQCDQGYTGSRCQHQVDDCASDPCQNSGTCIDQIDGFSCVCRPGYVGIQCEAEVDECISSPCNPAGTERCIDEDNMFTCHCNPGFIGKFCEVNVNECHSDPCMNGGICVDDINGFTCQCPDGWTGQSCEKDIGACDSDPCLNDADCIDLFQDYFCVCPSGTDGKRCETSPERCIGSPCMNGAICQDFGSGLNCTCPRHYSGIGCQFEFDACAAGICQNGATCEKLKEVGSYRCVCPEGYTGVNCENDIQDCTPTSCSPTATCIDLTNSYYCKCPFNLTGEDCRKTINIDYDLHFNDETKSSSASLATPFELDTLGKSLSVAVWVKFNNLDDQGTFFTLYSSGSPHVPTNKRMMLQADNNGIHVALFESASIEFIPYLQHLSINDGQWHHVAVIWSGNENTVRLVTDAAVTTIDYDEGNDMLPEFGWITLGAEQNSNNEAVAGKGFHGRVSRMNIWQRTLGVEVEIPTQLSSCKNAPVMFDDLIVRWTGFDRVSGNVERVGPGECGKIVCQPGYSGDNCKILAQDKESPVVDFCPDDQMVVTKNYTSIVRWDLPKFSDNIKVSRIVERSGYTPGQAFLRGVYELSYVAFDEGGNSATCSFKIYVVDKFCPIPEPPLGGELHCEDWGQHSAMYKVCRISCKDSLEFSDKVPDFYICGAEGFWRPSINPGMPITFPACSISSPAQRIFKIRMQFPSSVLCSDSGRKILLSKVRESVLQMNKDWGICADESANSCKGLDVNVKCAKQTRVTRQVENNDVYVVDIAFPANNDPVINVNTLVKDRVKNVVETTILQDGAFEVHGTLPNVNPDLTSLQLVSDFSCNLGQVVVRDKCVACSPGTFYDNSTQSCKSCSIGTYQNEMGKLFCKRCPGVSGSQGVTMMIGALSVESCKERCGAGKFYDTGESKCKSCGYGFYQPREGQFSCIPCGLGKTTRTEESVSKEECRSECESGQQLEITGRCQPCPRGKYRQRGRHVACIPCRADFTTLTVGATSSEQCTLRKFDILFLTIISIRIGAKINIVLIFFLAAVCKPGTYLNVSSTTCHPCPVGTYQSQTQQTECIRCPAGTTTKHNEQTGNDSCANPCMVDGKSQICDRNAFCLFKEETSHRKCECKPGFVNITRKNGGDECVDVCEGYCENSGKCKFDLRKSKPICACTGNFYGDRCAEKSGYKYFVIVKSVDLMTDVLKIMEMKFRKLFAAFKEFAYIAGGIAGAVIFIILLVLLIWMICVRTHRKKEPKKLLTQSTGELSGSQVNFYYGTPAPYAESIAPSHHSTYAHYYDDDEDGWEMPNFYNETYMKDGLQNSKGNSLARSNASLYGNKEDLYDRLRKHAYNGKEGTESNLEDQVFQIMKFLSDENYTYVFFIPSQLLFLEENGLVWKLNSANFSLAVVPIQPVKCSNVNVIFL
ncbi:Fibropellin-1 [Nymphon striatum]|nr:Fibropellin-1 [Nymphon striatum]